MKFGHIMGHFGDKGCAVPSMDIGTWDKIDDLTNVHAGNCTTFVSKMTHYVSSETLNSAN